MHSLSDLLLVALYVVAGLSGWAATISLQSCVVRTVKEAKVQGVAPPVWAEVLCSIFWRSQVSSCVTAKHEEFIEPWRETGYSTRPSDCPGLALLEQYGVFGAEPGTWAA
mmetsp:Transcript_47182/g.102703  ORF Transcript_47182/g.102703 Transcript_47182/m.102703 type:complete len:110 (+) Transcript_47182:186-515(+)